MTSTPEDAATLRERAERCFRLATKLSDKRTSDALMKLGRDLQAEADALDARIGGVLRELKGARDKGA